MSKMIIVEDHEDCREVLRFKDVLMNGLFIDNGGNLCQKIQPWYYNLIALSNGKLCGGRSLDGVPCDMPIKKILNVTKIEF